MVVVAQRPTRKRLVGCNTTGYTTQRPQSKLLALLSEENCYQERVREQLLRASPLSNGHFSIESLFSNPFLHISNKVNELSEAKR
jgi:hypothetical protein